MCTLTKRGLFAFLSQVDPCKATVTQRADGEFVPGKQQHNHPGKVGAALAANPAAARRSETRLAADPLSFREEIEENAAQRLPPTTIKNLYPVGGIQVRREDEQAAPTGLRTPVWSTRHIIPVGLTVVLDVALVQDQTAPLGATK